MTRTAWAVDRIAVIVVGLILIAVGVLAFIWRLDVWNALSQTSDTSAITDILNRRWWPWAVTGAGIILILLGLRWLWAHVPGRGVGDLNLPGTGEQGKLRFSGKAAASSAADALAAKPAVQSASGTIKRDRGQLVVDLKATVDSEADLEEIAADADQIVGDLARVMGRQDLYGRVHLTVSGSATKLARVS